MHSISIKVNGKHYHLTIPPYMSLLEVIREELHLTGTKEGCGSGECGACTVILDGTPVRSCLVLGVEADKKEIITIEGLRDRGKLHPIQEAFIEADAVQCGFCSPGFILAVKALLDRNPNPVMSEIKEALGGHLCRCTGYESIFKAVKLAADKISKRSK
ncbi:MAG: (2Fe-2S)-binding protein [Spirochaetes bacterium]|nr:MAG: (2Fe-2S)-binding protein [Spirochaetota bacterium]